MSSANLILVTATATKNDDKSIRKALFNLGSIDEDFNSYDYRWSRTIAENYNSNCEYLIDKVMDNPDLKTIEDKVNRFVHEWIKKDNYYTDSEVSYEYANDNVFIALAIAYAN